MNICIPVQEQKDLQSRISAHFGSAPFFMIVDTDTETFKTVPNINLHHGHGMCMPLQSLQNETIDGVVVGGIGAGAFNKLKSAQIEVYITKQSIVKNIIEEFKSSILTPLQGNQVCAHHGPHPHHGASGGHGPHHH